MPPCRRRTGAYMNILQTGLFSSLFPSVPDEGAWLYYLTYVGFILVTIVASYLLGSVNTAIVVSKLLYHDDIRTHGSGNAGLTNMLRTYGKGAAGLTLLGDILKTVIAILIAAVFFGFGYTGGISVGGDGTGFCYVAGLFAVLGHIFPIFYKFKGGKGVLATATMALVLSPVPLAILLVLFIVIVAVSKYVSLGSIVGVMFYPVLLSVYFSIFEASVPLYAAISSITLAILVIWCHRENIIRISNHTERRLSFKKKPEASSDGSDEENEG